MALIDKLTAIADAIRGKTGKTGALTLDQMAAEIAGIQTGGGDGGIDAAELVYETEFSINEIPESKSTLATIETGLTLADGMYAIVIKCVNDTLNDETNHFIYRLQDIFIASGYVSTSKNSGWIFSNTNNQFGAEVGVWVSAGGRYLKTITLIHSQGSNSYGYLPTGGYRLEVYKAKLDAYGLEVR